MGAPRQQLIDRAQRKYGHIRPCSGKKGWTECFTWKDGKLHLWFNSADHSTHIESSDAEMVPRSSLPLTAETQAVDGRRASR